MSTVAEAVALHELRLWVLSGGWCDFYHHAPEIEATFTSVARQVAIADALGVSWLRLFFGRLGYADHTTTARDRPSRDRIASRRAT